MSDRSSATASSLAWTVACIGVFLIFTAIEVQFAIRQSVWTDEATQLSGLSLGFADQLRWLVGRFSLSFPVPPDRMPPLSYWLGGIWSNIVGGGVLATRYLSVCLSMASLISLWWIGRRYLGRAAALTSAALLALSPNFIVLGAEIRAYAAFILFAVFLIYAYLRLLEARPTPSTNDLWSFAIAAALCSATHYFGIVISSGAVLCLLIYYLPVTSSTAAIEIARRARWPLLLYLFIVIGLLPFILAAMKVGGSPTAIPMGERIHSFLKLIYRLYSHQSMLGIPGLSIATALTGLLLTASAAIPGGNPRARPLLLLLLVNLAIVVILGLMTRAFNAFGPTYNAWALPLTALIVASAATHQNRQIRIACMLGVLVIIGADSYAAIRLSTAGEIYGHTRSRVLKDAIDEAGAENTAVLYFNDAPTLYFGLSYAYRGRLRQYIPLGTNFQLLGSPAGSMPTKVCQINSKTLLLAGDSELSAESLQFQITHPDVRTEAYRALQEFMATHRAEFSAQWKLVSANDYLAQSALALAIFKASSRDKSPSGCAAN